MAAISLGNMFNTGGRTVISGGSSNLDIDALINGLAEVRRLPAVRLETTIENNSTKIDALNELSTILRNFQDAANFLRNPPGVGNANDNIFAYRNATVSSNTGNGGSYLQVTAAAGTDPGNYTVSIDQLATRQRRVTESFAATNLSSQAVGGGGPFNAGTLTLGPNAVEVTLEDGDTLGDVLAKINAVKGESGVEVSAVKVTEGEYRLSFRSVETGTDQNWDFNAANAGMLNVGFASETDAVDALVTIDGVQVIRQSNTIDDLVQGITFQLTQATAPGTELTVSIAPDQTLAKAAVMNFVDAYNEFRVFAARMTETNDDGQRLQGAILGHNGALRTLVNAVGAEISGVVQGLADTNSLAALGLKLTDYPGDPETPFTRNILQVDEAALESALATDFDAVSKVFGFNYAVDNPNFVVFSRDNGLSATEAVFHIDQTNGVYEAVVNGQVITLTAQPLAGGGGVSLTAPKDSLLGGLNVLYTDSGDAVVTMTMTQGISDRLYNALHDALNENEGIVAQEVRSLDERNVRLQQDIERIDAMVERFRETLLEKFSALEAAIAAVNSILQLLDAQAQARNAR